MYSILAVFLLAQTLLRPAIQMKKSARILETPKLIRTISFGENIQIETGNVGISYSYDKVRFIEDYDESYSFWIWAGSKMQIVIYKESFTVGNSEEFLTFFKERCSQENPLWSKKEMNKRMLKYLLPISTVILALAVIYPIWVFF